MTTTQQPVTRKSWTFQDWQESVMEATYSGPRYARPLLAGLADSATHSLTDEQVQVLLPQLRMVAACGHDEY